MAVRLRIRSEDDSSDALVISSKRTDANPYIEGMPDGDGSSFDPVTGKPTSGSYSITVVDVETAANTRVVTAALSDASARQQLLSRKAYVETDTGSGWQVLVPGYITAIRMIDAIRFEFAVGDSRRIEMNRDIFKTATTKFNNVTAWVGGPVMQNWDVLRAYGGWLVRVHQVYTNPAYVQLKLVSGYDPRKYTGLFTRTSLSIAEYVREKARPYFEPSKTWVGAGGGDSPIQGSFPRLSYRLGTSANDPSPTFHLPLAQPQEHAFVGSIKVPIVDPDNIIHSNETSFYVSWTGTAPTVGARYYLHLYSSEIGTDNPIHIHGHPAEIVRDLFDDRPIGDTTSPTIAYDPASIQACVDALGPDLRVALRITKSYKLNDFLTKHIFGPFGLSTRIDSQGRYVLFTTRIKPSTLPSQTITLSNLRSTEDSIFEHDEKTIINRVTLSTERYSLPRAKSKEQEQQEPEVDGVVVVPRKIMVESSDPISAVGDREETYELPGMIQIGTNRDPDLEPFATGIAYDVFDRCGRGAIEGTLHCTPAVTAELGDEIILNLPHQVTSERGRTPVARRGGQRIVQIIQKTLDTRGPVLKVRDSGSTVQLSTGPTFTITKDTSDPRKRVTIAVTNIAALTTAGVTAIRIEAVYNNASPSTPGALVRSVPPSQWASWTLSADAGVRVAIRMRTERGGLRPSAYTTWQSVQLDAISPVGSLAVSAQNADDISRRTLTWTIGANAGDIPVEVLERFVGETTTQNRVVAVLPPGSTQYEIKNLDVANRIFSVRHKEVAPFAGESSLSTVTVNTTGTLPTLPAPIDPAAFSGELDTVTGSWVQTGRYGIEVTATAAPSFVEVEVAIETAVGSGTPGTYSSREQVPSVVSGRTRWDEIAANDGLHRFIRTRHVDTGKTASSYTTPAIVLPWSTKAPTIMPSVSISVTAVGGVTPRIDVAANSSRPGTIKIYRSTSNPATEADTLVATSLSGETSLTHSSTGLTSSTTYYYTAVITDLVSGIPSDPTSASAQGSAVFPVPSSPVPEITTLSGSRTLAGPVGDRYYKINSTAFYANASTGNAIRFLTSNDGVNYTQQGAFQTITPPSGNRSMTEMNILPPGSTYTFYIKAELRATASTGATLLSERVQTVSIPPI